jgi:curved DNA-binding protein CbpA
VDRAPDYYGVLGVSRTESFAGIHQAYRRLAKQHHPDHAGSESAPTFRAIQEAYQVLSDPERKRLYDETLRATHARIHTAAEPLVTSSQPRPEPFAMSPSGVYRDRRSALRHVCRYEIREFARISETLLSPLMLTSELTDDEVYVLRLYVSDLGDRYGF